MECQYAHGIRGVARSTSLDFLFTVMHAKGLAHVKLLSRRRPSIRKLPVEVVEQPRERDLHVGQPERRASAHPPAGAEGDELEVGTLEVHAAAGALGLEPLRPELLRALLVPRVPRDRPRVHEHHSTLWHIVA